MKNKVKLTESIQSKSVEPACAEFPSNVVRNSAKRFTDIVKSGKTGFQLKINTCILNTKPLSCSYKRFSDCPIHSNVVRECC